MELSMYSHKMGTSCDNNRFFRFLKSQTATVSQYVNTARQVSLTLSQTTNFRLFQIEKVCIQQFQILWKW